MRQIWCLVYAFCLLASPVVQCLRIPHHRQQDGLMSARDYLLARADTGNANNFLDTVLENFRNDPEFRNKVDPLYLDDIIQDKFKILNGVVRGLLSLHRSGDCSLDYEEEDESIVVDCEMKVKNVLFTSQYGAKAVFFWINGDVDASVEAVDIAIGFKVPSEGRPSLKRFQIKELHNIEVHNITGLSIAFNWLAKLIANFVVSKFEESIRNTIEVEVRKFISQTLETVDIPF